MLLLDIILRGSSIGLLVLLAGLLWRAPIGGEGRLSIVAVALAESAHLLKTAPIPLDLPPLLMANVTLFSSLMPNAITWLIVTIFLDPPGKRWPWLLASSVVSAHYYLFKVAPHLVANIPCGVSALALFGALFVLAIISSRDDLVECRCRARPGFAAAIAGLGILLAGTQTFDWMGLSILSSALLASTGTFAVTFAFAIWILRPDTSLWPGVQPDQPSPQPNTTPPIDGLLIERIRTAMTAGIWREEGLAIGALALRLNVPEHRLRRAINTGLGYRNFSAFINRARIQAAMAQLTDPEQADTTVLEIAYDVGFASLGPFNRAFRAETGQSPTEFRRAAFALPANKGPDSENHTPIPTNLH